MAPFENMAIFVVYVIFLGCRSSDVLECLRGSVFKSEVVFCLPFLGDEPI